MTDVFTHLKELWETDQELNTTVTQAALFYFVHNNVPAMLVEVERLQQIEKDVVFDPRVRQLCDDKVRLLKENSELRYQTSDAYYEKANQDCFERNVLLEKENRELKADIDRIDRIYKDACFGITKINEENTELKARLEIKSRLLDLSAAAVEASNEHIQQRESELHSALRRIEKMERAIGFIKSQLCCMDGGDAVRASLDQILEGGE